jgi:SAM-dependent methyltransferase
MGASFDINAYWTERGRHYDSESRLAGDYHKLQESFLIDVLKLARVPMQRVLEVGCGFGRITKVLAEAFPGSAIMAVDLSDAQIEKAKTFCAGCAAVQFQQYDFYSGSSLPGGSYDTVVAAEVFLHHPREAVKQIAQRLASAASQIVNIDWCEDWRTPVSEHVWIHNYRALYKELGLACAGFALPQRVDGKQQRLFVATKSLWPELRHLERLLSYYGRLSSEPSWEHEDGTPRAHPPPDWNDSLLRAEEDLRGVVPDGATLILADDGQWTGAVSLNDHRVLPFTERDGSYWGPPDSDDAALAELERMRGLGAEFFALAWPAFWWLEHYTSFAERLRLDFPCVLENERLMVFRLRS